MYREWGDEPEWMHDARQLEEDVREALRAAAIPTKRQAGWTNVRSGFDTAIEGISEGAIRVSVHWRARYDYVLRPNEAHERLTACATILRERGFDVRQAFEELMVRRPVDGTLRAISRPS